MGTTMKMGSGAALALAAACVLFLAAQGAPVDSPLAMNVTVTNLAGVDLQIRAVDPNTGTHGVTICGGGPLANGTSCTGIAEDWIAAATGGSWDAGDPFDVWWGDESWRTAVAHYNLVQAANNYIQYQVVKSTA